jgi:hypothetical protein
MRSFIVYSLYAKNGDLLYIGKSINGLSRVHDHSAQKNWFPHVESVKITHCDSNLHCISVEKEMIERLSPIHNVAYQVAENGRSTRLKGIYACKRVRRTIAGAIFQNHMIAASKEFESDKFSSCLALRIMDVKNYDLSKFKSDVSPKFSEFLPMSSEEYISGLNNSKMSYKGPTP